MNSMKAKKLLQQAEEDRRRSFYKRAAAERQLKDFKRIGCVASAAIQDTEEALGKAILAYAEADLRVGELRTIVNAKTDLAKKVEPWLGMLLTGLICAVLFPLVGAIAIPGGLWPHIIAGIVYGVVMYCVCMFAPAVGILIGDRYYPNLVFSLFIVALIALPAVAVWLLSLTAILSVLSLLKLAIGIVVTVVGYFFFPRLVSGLI